MLWRALCVCLHKNEPRQVEGILARRCTDARDLLGYETFHVIHPSEAAGLSDLL